jgi:hypothetical protein
MSRTSFRTPRCRTPNSRGIHKAFGRAVNSTVRTMASFSSDGSPATATNVLWFRLFYLGYGAALYFSLVPLSKTRRDPWPSQR